MSIAIIIRKKVYSPLLFIDICLNKRQGKILFIVKSWNLVLKSSLTCKSEF